MRMAMFGCFEPSLGMNPSQGPTFPSAPIGMPYRALLAADQAPSLVVPRERQRRGLRG